MVLLRQTRHEEYALVDMHKQNVRAKLRPGQQASRTLALQIYQLRLELSER